MSTQPMVDPHTGEVTERDPAEIAAQWAHASRLHQAVCDQMDELAAERKRLADDMAHLSGLLLSVAEPGDVYGDVIVRSGPRRNARVDRDAIERHAEELEALGLIELVHPPAPPPRIKPASVTRIRASEVDLAKHGIRVTDLVVDGGPGDPILELTEGND